MDTAYYSVYKKAAPPLNKGTHAQYTLQLSFELFYPPSLPWSDHHVGGVLSGLAPALRLCSFLPQQFGAVCGNDSSLCTCAAATYPDQVLAAPWIIEHLPWPTLAKFQIWKLLAAANPQPPAAPSVPDVERSRHSNRSGDRSHNSNAIPSEKGRSPHRGGHTRARDKSTSQKIRDLDARLDAINTGTNAPITVDALVRQTDPPFTERVLRTRISSKFKLPTQLGIYEGKTDPMDHLDSYKKPNVPPGFNQAVLNVEDPSDKVIIMAMMEGLRPGPLFDSLSKNVPETLSALQSKADKYIAAEELAEAKRRRRGKEDHKRKEPDTRRVNYREEMRYKRPDRDSKRSNNRRPRTPPRRPEFNLPSLNTPVAQVLSQRLSTRNLSNGPERLGLTPRREEQEQIFPPPNSPERKYGDNRRTAGNIQTIHGGFGSGGCSTSSRKRHARSAFRSIEEEVYNLSSPCASDQPPITFSSDDLRGLHLPHDDALVVSAVIANFNVQRILIDSGNTTHPLGWINLPITLGTEPQQTTVWQEFIVVDCPSPYNSILGRPTLGRFKAITSTYHLKMKFPTLTGIGETAGDDVETLRDEMEQLILEDPRETENTKPLEEVTQISIHPNHPERQVMIGTELTDDLRIALTDFLKRNSDVFAWSQGDVPGIDPEVAMHKLFTKPDYSPVRQKRRKFAPERLKVIEDEISKLIKANPRTAIKAQALSDFIVESTHEDTPQPEATPLEAGISKEPTSEQNLAHWILYVDGSSNQHGCGAGLVLRAPSGEQMEYAIRMGFQATNNEAEYEALLAELRVATELGAQSLEVFSDSQLVVNQVQGDYLAKDSRMIAYLGEVKTLSAKIKEFKINQIPREDNKKADALANLASTFEFISDRCIPLEFLTHPSIGVANQILQMEENPTWLDEIIDYLRKGILPKDKLQARRLQYRSARFYSESQRLSSRTTPSSSTTTDSDYFVRISPSPIISPRQVILNGQIEVTNRTILRNLKARLERSKSEWAEDLPSIIWAYHTTSRIPTGETPYSLVFGTESVIPVEIGVPSFRTLNFNRKGNEGELRLNLDLLDEKRERARITPITPSAYLQRSDRQILQRKSKAPLIPPWRPSLAKGNPIHERSESREARSNMGRPLQSYQGFQAGDLLAGGSKRKSTSASLECRAFEKVLSMNYLFGMCHDSPISHLYESLFSPIYVAISMVAHY
ncbi:hypothetical protein Acr_00g0050520 [Actinidia rufa]|uniref:RNase H type-1 domain-containing protein n=1 Tax=Actinidia rufa TaxID=165716 RepID=A0A7J0DM58_9ERIC|nr:hypothetical protein Acr_00g0050520 [Actinidia rufa]